MIVITNRLPLRTLYPKPEEKCGIITGNIDRQEYPELSSLLYRVSFKVKSDQTGLIEKRMHCLGSHVQWS